MKKLYLWIRDYFYRLGSRVVRVAVTAALMPGDFEVLLPGDAAPSYAVSGFQPDIIASLYQQISLPGQRPGTADIGATPLYYSLTNKC